MARSSRGPVDRVGGRAGGTATGRSVYTRDPDGNLVELIAYRSTTRGPEIVRWHVHGERSLYESEWVGLSLVDVELPSGRRFEHHVVRMPASAAGVVVTDPDHDGVLLLWRHRFTTDTWGWEIPAGRVDAGESPSRGRPPRDARGDRLAPGSVAFPRQLLPVQRDLRRHVPPLRRRPRRHTSATPIDTDEAERVAWVPWADVRSAIDAGQVGDGLSLTALLWVLAHPI